MVRIVIYIRYKSLSPGMHAEAEHGSRGATVVYLLPGLTTAQRGAALRRLRREGTRGCGPRLPSGQLAVALVADRLRAGVTHTAAAIRQHPVGMLLPPLLAGLLLTMFVFGSAAVRDSGATAPGTRGAANMSVDAGVSEGQGGSAGTRPNAASVGGRPAGTSSAGVGGYAAVALGRLTGTGAEVAGLAASAGAATAPLPEAPPLPKGPGSRSTQARGSVPVGRGGGVTSSTLPAPKAPVRPGTHPRVPPGM